MQPVRANKKVPTNVTTPDEEMSDRPDRPAEQAESRPTTSFAGRKQRLSAIRKALLEIRGELDVRSEQAQSLSEVDLYAQLRAIAGHVNVAEQTAKRLEKLED